MHRLKVLPVLVLLAAPGAAPCREFCGDADRIVVDRQSKGDTRLPALSP